MYELAFPAFEHCPTSIISFQCLYTTLILFCGNDNRQHCAKGAYFSRAVLFLSKCEDDRLGTPLDHIQVTF